MPISATDLQELGKVSLDEHLRNIPVSQIATEKPLLKTMLGKRKILLPHKQNSIELVRKSHGSNFAWTYGEAAVNFNKRHTNDEAGFPWRRCVDALYIDHDRLFGAGIKVKEGERGQYKLERNEKVQLLDLINDQMDVLKDGFQENLDLSLHRDGSASTDAVTGLDALVSLTPEVGTVGNINAATATYWRNYAKTAISTATKGTLLLEMEAAWRKCIRNGGSPDFILCGGKFLDAYAAELVVTQNANAADPKKLDGGRGTGVKTGLYFKGVELMWDPQFETLDALDAPAVEWEKRCYFINTKHIKYKDDEMDIISPTRPHNVLALYSMVNLRLALTTNRRNAHAVLAIA